MLADGYNYRLKGLSITIHRCLLKINVGVVVSFKIPIVESWFNSRTVLNFCCDLKEMQRKYFVRETEMFRYLQNTMYVNNFLFWFNERKIFCYVHKIGRITAGTFGVVVSFKISVFVSWVRFPGGATYVIS